MGVDGLEPPTSCVSDRYSNQTELHTHIFVAVERFELSTPSFRDWCSNQLRYTAIRSGLTDSRQTLTDYITATLLSPGGLSQLWYSDQPRHLLGK